ncbi:putative 30S ribosomal protein S16 [Gorgonomyces haynaldii]|nr:putative 30S ribosomal protein S16 [Gorgonomyces haynaldii]
MVVKIKLSRWGVRNNPFYGIIAQNHYQSQFGKTLEKLGTYNPVPIEGTKHVEVNVERVKYWLSVGAQMTSRVNWLLAKYGIVPLNPRVQEEKQYRKTEPVVPKNDRSRLVYLQRETRIH